MSITWGRIILEETGKCGKTWIEVGGQESDGDALQIPYATNGTEGCTITTGVLISPQPDQEGNKLQRQKILSFIYPICNHNWRNISAIYIYNKTSIKRNILTIKQNTSGSRSDCHISTPVLNVPYACFDLYNVIIRKLYQRHTNIENSANEMRTLERSFCLQGICKCNVIHVSCNSLIIQYLVRLHSRQCLFVTYRPATCFDFYKVIVRDVYAKTLKDSQHCMMCVCVRVYCMEHELRYIDLM